MNRSSSLMIDKPSTDVVGRGSVAKKVAASKGFDFQQPGQQIAQDSGLGQGAYST